MLISCLWSFGREDLQCNVFPVYQRVLSKPNYRAGSVPKFIDYDIFVVVEFVTDLRRMITPGTVAVDILDFIWFLEPRPYIGSTKMRYDFSYIWWQGLKSLMIFIGWGKRSYNVGQCPGDRIRYQGRHIVFAPRAGGDEKVGFDVKGGIWYERWRKVTDYSIWFTVVADSLAYERVTKVLTRPNQLTLTKNMQHSAL